VTERPPEPRFEPGVDLWLAGLAGVRDAVRQGLVQRQLASHLPSPSESLRVLDAGCGQGTQTILLARLGYRVVGVDVSERLLNTAQAAAGREPVNVQRRIRFVRGDIRHLSRDHRGAYDVVCCHGVAMYLPTLEAAVDVVVGAAASRGLISLLTRNRFSLAMRAGMSRDWRQAVQAFDARHYDNRIGIASVRADEPLEVQDAFAARGASVHAWYGVRLFTDHWGPEDRGVDFATLLQAEEEAGRRDPYRLLAALTHTIVTVR
jgi:S-adenosylmethionine-dependent methyltransferase